MYSELEENLNYKFVNIKLLENAFRHTSYTNENKMKPEMSNQRLEFLGDSVLSLSISTSLYHKYENMLEGDMTKLRASIVRESSLAKMARKLQLGKHLKFSYVEKQNKAYERDSILADCMEAVFGAIYLDSGFDDAKKVICTLFDNDIVENKNTFQRQDYKTVLQEIIQAYSQVPLLYKTVKEEGQPHNRVFYVEVYHEDKKLGAGKARSKKQAEQNSAQEAIKYLEKADK